MDATLRGGDQRQAYAEWLQSYNWDYFLTSTFKRPRKEPYYATQAVWATLQEHNAGRAFLVAEPFQSGDLHVHGVVAGYPPPSEGMDLPWEVWGHLFHKFGRAKVEACNSQEAVSLYCAKYILKQQSRVCDYYAVHGAPYTWHAGKIEKTPLERELIAAGGVYYE